MDDWWPENQAAMAPFCGLYGTPTPWHRSQVLWCAQGRIRSGQPPAPSLFSGILDSVVTMGSGGSGGEIAMYALTFCNNSVLLSSHNGEGAFLATLRATATIQPRNLHRTTGAISRMGRFSAARQAHCPNCNVDTFTSIERRNGCLTWLCCFLIFIFGGVFFCCFIPFCCAKCQDVQHKCPNCRKQLGYYRRL
ncbi:unnamed protein product [Schistocephalus solidus]|uniref:LITAF domain-containing protein n=1 Tax=Schistocephalus solidus TaxID=70667 RepID=A0A183STC8_SCHSO|nr:unnamed protein product [Schistocephalus solidus]